jgi:cyanate permease
MRRRLKWRSVAFGALVVVLITVAGLALVPDVPAPVWIAIGAGVGGGLSVYLTNRAAS